MWGPTPTGGGGTTGGTTCTQTLKHPNTHLPNDIKRPLISRGQNKVSKMTLRESKNTIFSFPSQNSHFRSKKVPLLRGKSDIYQSRPSSMGIYRTKHPKVKKCLISSQNSDFVCSKGERSKEWFLVKRVLFKDIMMTPFYNNRVPKRIRNNEKEKRGRPVEHIRQPCVQKVSKTIKSAIL